MLNPNQWRNSHIKDTTDFLNKLSNLGNLPNNAILVTLDVSSLYTNIPHNQGIDACRHFLDCEQSLFFFRFSESNARARVSRFARRTTEKKETARSLVIFLIPALTNTSPQRHYVISYAWFCPWIISHLTNSIIFKSMALLWVLKWLLLLLTFFLVCWKPTLSLTPLGSLTHGGDILMIFSWSGQNFPIVWK